MTRSLKASLALPQGWEAVLPVVRAHRQVLRILWQAWSPPARLVALLGEWGDALVLSSSVRDAAPLSEGELRIRVELLLNRDQTPYFLRADVQGARPGRPRRPAKLRLEVRAIRLMRDPRVPAGVHAVSVDMARQIFIQRHLEDIETERATADAGLQALLAGDLAMTRESYRLADNQPLRLAVRGARYPRPVLEPMLQILPRCIDAPLDQVLASCAALAERGSRMGFRQVMIGGVEPQTTELYYGQSDNGLLIESLNDHGYWCTGWPGVDEALGGAFAYVALVQALGAMGLAAMQDVAPGSLGYPEQFPDGRDRAIRRDLSLLRIRDSLFGPDAQEDRHVRSMSTDRFVSPFRLPKPALTDPRTFEAMLHRMLWYLQNAGVRRFRIDMARHIPLVPLRELLERLRKAVAGASCGDSTVFRAILEYWSGHYRDLASAMHALAGCEEGVYFYDFPLAYLIRSLVLTDAPLKRTVIELVRNRDNFGITTDWLVPFFIDHDGEFQPIYDGSKESATQVVVGLALAMSLSSNGPCMYAGFNVAHAGQVAASTKERGHVRARLPVISTADVNGPSDAIAPLLGLLETFPDALTDYTAPIGIDGDSDSLTILRAGVPKKEGTPMVKFSFSRCELPALDQLGGWTRVYSCEGRMSVAVDVLK